MNHSVSLSTSHLLSLQPECVLNEAKLFSEAYALRTHFYFINVAIPCTVVSLIHFWKKVNYGFNFFHTIWQHLEFSLEDVVDLPSAFSWAKVGGMYTLLPCIFQDKSWGHASLASKQVLR